MPQHAADRRAIVLRVAERVNPFFVVVSLIGLILQFTPLYSFPIYALNAVISFWFVFYVVAHLMSMPLKEYLITRYGWVDLLAMVPAITLFLPVHGKLFAIFKLVQLARMLSVTHILRRLKIASPVRYVRKESKLLEMYMMRICASIVVVFVAGIFFCEVITRNVLLDTFKNDVTDVYAFAEKDVTRAAAFFEETVAYMREGVLYDSDGKAIQETAAAKKIESLIQSEYAWYECIAFSSETSYHPSGITFPSEGIVIRANDIQARYNALMLALILTLVGILVAMTIFVGFMLVQDINIIHMVVESLRRADPTLIAEYKMHPYTRAQSEEYNELLNVTERASLRLSMKSLTTESETPPKRPELYSDPAGRSIGAPIERRSFNEDAIKRAITAALAEREIVTNNELAIAIENAIEQSARLSAKTIIDYLKKERR